jgi:hypothetical protein
MKYVVLDADEVSDIVFSEVLEDSENTLAWNADDSQTFVKYEGAKPRFLYGKDTLSHTEILALLNTSAWNTPQE